MSSSAPASKDMLRIGKQELKEFLLHPEIHLRTIEDDAEKLLSSERSSSLLSFRTATSLHAPLWFYLLYDSTDRFSTGSSLLGTIPAALLSTFTATTVGIGQVIGLSEFKVGV